jgi:excisionase family DNA binding protein
MTEDAFNLVEDGLMRVSEACRLTMLSRSTLYALMEKGFLAYVKIGRSRRIPRRALLELVTMNLQGAWRKLDAI